MCGPYVYKLAENPYLVKSSIIMTMNCKARPVEMIRAKNVNKIYRLGIKSYTQTEYSLQTQWLGQLEMY